MDEAQGIVAQAAISAAEQTRTAYRVLALLCGLVLFFLIRASGLSLDETTIADAESELRSVDEQWGYIAGLEEALGPDSGEPVNEVRSQIEKQLARVYCALNGFDDLQEEVERAVGDGQGEMEPHILRARLGELARHKRDAWVARGLQVPFLNESVARPQTPFGIACVFAVTLGYLLMMLRNLRQTLRLLAGALKGTGQHAGVVVSTVAAHAGLLGVSLVRRKSARAMAPLLIGIHLLPAALGAIAIWRDASVHFGKDYADQSWAIATCAGVLFTAYLGVACAIQLNRVHLSWLESTTDS